MGTCFILGMRYGRVLAEVLSFVIAATWVSLATVLAERLGTRTGAMFTTLPSTVVVALYFIAVDQGAGFAAEVAAVAPAEMGINAVFLAVFVATSRRGLPTTLAASLGVWTALSAALYLLDPRSLPASLAAFVVLVTATVLWLRTSHRFQQQAGRRIRYTPGEIAFRGLFAGLIISLSVVGSSIGGPVVGGILSVFPAIFTSTMVILYIRQGQEFSGAVGSLLIVGSANVVVYAVVANQVFPGWGETWGTLIALAISYGWSLGLYLVVRRWVA